MKEENFKCLLNGEVASIQKFHVLNEPEQTLSETKIV